MLFSSKNSPKKKKIAHPCSFNQLKKKLILGSKREERSCTRQNPKERKQQKRQRFAKRSSLKGDSLVYITFCSVRLIVLNEY